MAQVQATHGDLLDQPVEAIVNAWNRNFIPWWLLLPQGVSGAIKKRGGYQPFRELSRFGVLRPGDARLTSAGRLPFKGIIHVAALNGLWRSHPTIIRACVTNALRLASEYRFESVAIPLVGAGTGGVSAAISKAEIVNAAKRSEYQGRVTIVTFALDGT